MSHVHIRYLSSNPKHICNTEQHLVKVGQPPCLPMRVGGGGGGVRGNGIGRSVQNSRGSAFAGAILKVLQWICALRRVVSG